MDIISKQLQDIYSIKAELADKWVDHLNKAMNKYGITTPLRQAAFLAQVGHESGRLKFVKEIWNPKQCVWQNNYEGSKSLGNTQVGDGEKFKGHGLIQITGRANHAQAAHDLGIDCVNNPELLCQPQYAALVSAWFWDINKINFYADKSDIDGVSDKVNKGHKTDKYGDSLGFKDRLDLYTKAKKVLNA